MMLPVFLAKTFEFMAPYLNRIINVKGDVDAARMAPMAWWSPTPSAS